MELRFEFIDLMAIEYHMQVRVISLDDFFDWLIINLQETDKLFKTTGIVKIYQLRIDKQTFSGIAEEICLWCDDNNFDYYEATGEMQNEIIIIVRQRIHLN